MLLPAVETEMRERQRSGGAERGAMGNPTLRQEIAKGQIAEIGVVGERNHHVEKPPFKENGNRPSDH